MYVPEGYVPAGLEDRELHVPLHLVNLEEDSHGSMPMGEGSSVQGAGMRPPVLWKGVSGGPPKLQGALAMPFAERKGPSRYALHTQTHRHTQRHTRKIIIIQSWLHVHGSVVLPCMGG